MLMFRLMSFMFIADALSLLKRSAEGRSDVLLLGFDSRLAKRLFGNVPFGFMLK